MNLQTPLPPAILAAWLHDLNPFIVEFTPGFGVRWYGTAYALGFVAGWLLLRWLSNRGVTPLSVQRITDAMLVLCLGVVLGGRLGYIAFYDPALLVTFTSSPPWWGVLQLNKGGMSSHGGMIGVLTACWIISRGVKDSNGKRIGALPMLHVMDLTALACTPGLFFGRLANFVNGELLGSIVTMPGKTPSPWWAVKFPQERFSGHEPVLSAEQTLSMQRLMDAYRVGAESDAAAYDRVLHILQSGKGQSAEIAAKLAPLIAARHPSQLYQGAAEGLILGLVLLLAWRKPRKPGVIVAFFLIGYGVMRIITEFYRLPDVNIVMSHILGLSRGQWLSVAMIGFGALALYLSRRRAETYGGWRRRAKMEMGNGEGRPAV